MQDVVKQYGGEDKYFVTGFEAEAIPLGNSVQSSRSGASVRSSARTTSADGWMRAHLVPEERTVLPIRNLIGTKDDLCAVGNPIYTQMQRAMSLADAHGYKNVSLVRVEERDTNGSLTKCWLTFLRCCVVKCNGTRGLNR